MLSRAFTLFSVSLLSWANIVTGLPAFGGDYPIEARELLASSQTGLYKRDASTSSNVSVSTFVNETINSLPGLYVCALDCASLWTIYGKCDLTNSSVIDTCLCNVNDNDAWATCTSCIAVQQGNTTAQQNYTSAAQSCYTSGCGRALNYTTGFVATYTTPAWSSTPTSTKSASATATGATSSAAAGSVYMAEGRTLFSVISMMVAGLVVL